MVWLRMVWPEIAPFSKGVFGGSLHFSLPGSPFWSWSDGSGTLREWHKEFPTVLVQQPGG